MTIDTAPIRSGEELQIEPLAEYLRAHLPEWQEPFTIEQFPGGHSNLTYLLRLGGCELVLRRPPVGPVAPTAHDMVRECRLLELVHPVFPLAPRPRLLCEDASVLGVPFYVMERRRGIVVRRDLPPAFEDLRLRRRLSESVVDTLALLHTVDIDAHGLAAIGKPLGMLERHIRGWTRRWEGCKLNGNPSMEHLASWLLDRLPAAPPRYTIIHNDYKLDNIMLAEDDPAQIVAIFDWEMATVGDPLVDLGILLSYWPQADDPEARREAISGVTALPGWLSRAEVVERYARRTGFAVSQIAFYETYALFRVAVVLQQIYFRYQRGQTRDERFREFDKRVAGLAEAAREMAERL